MPDPNAFISNGTCYYEANEESPSNMLPCGNAALGHKHCCQAGDMCLDSGTCYNEGLGVTYMAGCSDPEFESDGCMDSVVGSNIWVRLYLCENAESSALAHCSRESAAPSTIDSSECACPTSFTGNTVPYSSVVELPTSLGESVIWQPGYVPTSSDKSSSSARETSDMATATIGDIDDAGDNSDGRSRGLSVGAKAGIGVGVSLAGLLILGIIFLLLKRRKSGAPDGTRKTRVGSIFARKTNGAAAAREVEKGRERGPLPAELPVRPGTPPPSELADNTARSELDGTGSNRGSVVTWNRGSEVSAGTWNRG